LFVNHTAAHVFPMNLMLLATCSTFRATSPVVYIRVDVNRPLRANTRLLSSPLGGLYNKLTEDPASLSL